MVESTPQPKGVRAEEQLRAYFLGLGYYVTRGVKIRVEGTDITDIDLWLYHKHSPLGRERINVDIKNKKTPQAIERIFWARGVQVTLGLDKCIVATTDRRKVVVDYGRQHGVTVIDGHFLSRLPANSESGAPISEEDFRRGFGLDGRARNTSESLLRLEAARSRLVSALNFDGCNAWLADVRYFVESTISGILDNDSGHRAIYVTVSQLLIGLDYSLSPVAFLPQPAKRDTLDEGLRHGAEGKSRTNSVLNVATMLVQQYVPDGRSLAERIRRDVDRLTDDTPVGILAEYLSTTRVSSELFKSAKRFADLAYAQVVTPPNELPSDMKSMLAVLMDFFGLSRQQLFGSVKDAQLRLGTEG